MAALDDDCLRQTLQTSDIRTLATAEAVCHRWRSCGNDSWSALLLKHFEIQCHTSEDPKHAFAVELGWKRGRGDYRSWSAPFLAATDGSPQEPSLTTPRVHVEAASASALVATLRRSCVRVHLPRAGEVVQQAWSDGATPHRTHGDCAPDALALAELMLKEPAATRLTTTAAAAHSAAFGYSDGSLEVCCGWPGGTESTHSGYVPNVSPDALLTLEMLPPCSPSHAAGAPRLRVLSGGQAGDLVLTEVDAPAPLEEVSTAAIEGADDAAAHDWRGRQGFVERLGHGETAEAWGARELLHMVPEPGCATVALATGRFEADAGNACEADAAALPATVCDCAAVGTSRGHVNVVDMVVGRVSGSILSSCACAPHCLRVLGGPGSSPLLGVTRLHAFSGSGHGDTVALWDLRGLEHVTTLWPGSDGGRASVNRSSKGEQVVGMAMDGHKLVSASAHGLICAWDVRTWRVLFSTAAAARSRLGGPPREPLTGLHCGADWIVAVGQRRLHLLTSQGEAATASFL